MTPHNLYITVELPKGQYAVKRHGHYRSHSEADLIGENLLRVYGCDGIYGDDGWIVGYYTVAVQPEELRATA